MADAEFLLLGDALWLDFVNSEAGPGRPDQLSDSPALLRWTKALRLESPADASAFDDAQRFRQQLTSMAKALAAKRVPPASVVEAVNARLSSLEGREHLIRVSGAWKIRFAPSRQPSALEAIARSVAETLANPLAIIRTCANAECGLYLMDVSSNQSRRFCSPSRCGLKGRAERRRRSRPTPLVNEL